MSPYPSYHTRIGGLLGGYRDEFKKNISVDKRDFSAIEFMLRKGQRQLDIYSAPGIKDIHR